MDDRRMLTDEEIIAALDLRIDPRTRTSTLLMMHKQKIRDARRIEQLVLELANLERDQLWCKALIDNGDTQVTERITALFNASREAEPTTNSGGPKTGGSVSSRGGAIPPTSRIPGEAHEMMRDACPTCHSNDPDERDIIQEFDPETIPRECDNDTFHGHDCSVCRSANCRTTHASE